MDTGKPSEQHWPFIHLIFSTSKSTMISECPHFVHSLIEQAGHMAEVMNDLFVMWETEFYPNSACF